MKTKAPYLGIAAIALLIISTLLKINHWPGGISLQFITLAILIIPFILINAFANLKHSRLNALIVLAGCCLTLFVVGFIFKQLHWSGASIVITAGFFLSIIVLSIFLFKNSNKEEGLKQPFSFPLILIIILITMTFQASYTSFPRNIIDGYSQTLITQMSVNENLLELNKLSSGSISSKDKQMSNFHSSLNSLNQDIEKIKQKIASETNNHLPVSDYADILRKENSDITNYIMIIQGEASAIKEELRRLSSMAAELEIEDPIKQQLRNLLSTPEFNPDPNIPGTTWESQNFEHLPVMSAIVTLTQIQNKLLLAEYVSGTGISK